MYVGFDNGYFKVLDFYGIKEKTREKLWKCECKCGNIKIHSSTILKRLDIKSCGCGRKGINKKITHTLKHGLSDHPIYKTWASMKDRCKSKRDSRFYKDKGIKVCDEWLKDFLNFYNWALNNGWKKGLTIDRIDSNLGYNPSNCRFISRSENSKRTPIENRRGSLSHLSKLSESDIDKIKQMLKDDVKGVEIAKIFNVTKSNIYSIKHGKSWKWRR